MITEEKIKRINELSHKSKTPEGLTKAVAEEQKKLRREYIDAFKLSLTSQLDNTYYINEQGKKTKLKRNKKNNG